MDRFALALYPLVDAATGAEVGLSPAQWRKLGAAVRRTHALAPKAELAALAGREAFRPSRRELLPALEDVVARPRRPTRWWTRWPGSGRRTGT